MIYDKFPFFLSRFGFVDFDDVETAKSALTEMSGASIDGREVRLDYSSPRPEGGGRGGGRGGGFGGRGGGGYGGGFGGRGGGGGRGRGGRGGNRGGGGKNQEN